MSRCGLSPQSPSVTVESPQFQLLCYCDRKQLIEKPTLFLVEFLLKAVSL